MVRADAPTKLRLWLDIAESRFLAKTAANGLN
jgi:hypothetical protein